MHVTDEMVDLIREAIRFAFWAAGEGFCAAESFLFNYSTASGDEDLETLADRVSAALRAAPAAEPVAWLLTSEMTGNVVLWTQDQHRAASEELKRGCAFTPLYAAPPAPVADGWVMVPKDEMTDAMMDAGQAYLNDKSLNGRFRLPGGFNWHEFWHAMLAAAPPAPGGPRCPPMER